MKNTVPFDVMVSNLFKTNEAHAYNTSATNLVHAAIGIVGECIELAMHTSKENFIEEAGDTEFYVEAYIQALETLIGFEVSDKPIRTTILEVQSKTSVTTTFTALLVLANEVLDVTKKVWVYNKPMDVPLVYDLLVALGTLRATLSYLYMNNGTTVEEVITANQEKLGKRYPAGVYSDQHAQQRLDKVGG